MPDKPHAYHAWQELAEAYAARVDTKPHNAWYDRPAMLSLLPDLNGRHVLDAGCGPGVYTETLVARGATVVACDVSDRMLQLAGQRLKDLIGQGSVELRELDLEQPLDMFDDGIFDVVNAPLCLDYVEDWTTLFREFRRVLKPGGVFLFSCGHPAFDAEYYQTSKYFSIEKVESEWTGFGIRVDMPGFRRSLEHLLMPVLQAGLVLDRIHEPLPTEEFRNADPRRHAILMHRPGFLCVRAVNPASAAT